MARVLKTNPTLAQAAYDRLRADLLSGRLRPGEPVKISEIGLSFGTNVNAIREALSRLTSEGLVVATPQKGFSATPISAAELRDLTGVRIQIEASCLERSIAQGDVNWETQIVAALHRLSRTQERVPGDPDQTSEDWARHHAAFHKALVAGCDSPWLLRLRETLYTQSERYRRLSVPFANFDRDLTREHTELANAVVGKDVARAMALMTNHLQATTDILLMHDLFAGAGEQSQPAPWPRSRPKSPAKISG